MEAQRNKVLVLANHSSVNTTAVDALRANCDVVEIPIIEERLVKQPVVTEVVRVRKNAVSDTHEVQADLRKEDVEVETEGDYRVREDDKT